MKEKDLQSQNNSFSKIKIMKKKNRKNKVFQYNTPKQTKKYFLMEIGFIVFMICCLIFLSQTRFHRVDGESMLPTVKNNDYLFISKRTPVLRYSVVTFEPPGKPDESYIKRIVAIPGDRIWLDKNMVYLNYQMADDNLTPANDQYLSGADLPDGTLKVRVTWDVAAALEKYDRIPEGYYFVLGDNRNHSTDSRHLGLIEQKKIEGVAVFRYYPFSRIGAID